MANLLDVADVIATISDTFEDAVVQCMDDNREVVADMIREQLYSGIRAEVRTPVLHVYTAGFADGPLIERKYGEDIFMPGEIARAYFNENYLKPHLLRFFEQCGYR